MNRLVLGAALTLLAAGTAATAAVRHDLRAIVDPAAHRIDVDDLVTLAPAKEGRQARTIPFLLHAGLQPSSPTPRVRLKKMTRKPEGADFGVPADRFSLSAGPPVEFWTMTVPRDVEAVALSYGGTIHHPVENRGEDYARSFGETPGTIGPEGAYLSGASRWIPWFGPEPFPFELEVTLPAGWDAVSQGRRTRFDAGDDGTTVAWSSPEPQTEAYLVAARFTTTTRSLGAIDAMAYLRDKDDALASKYLDATERYLKMYEGLLGPYPYPKFALVENFWETGYGMPSFTLLGSRVIRLPFILNSSYPHEILHNWWGNGVYVDAARGNWCEGLTAYLADHLLAEQSGDASEYRQTTLQKYADYVSKAKDFPLTEFRERHSPATEAVGYGKSLMLFHELRREAGDETFAKALRLFYETNRFKEATFDDLQRAFDAATGRPYAARFEQAVSRAGAPRLALRGATARADGDGWIVEGTVEQIQGEDPFTLSLPLAITMEGPAKAFETTIAIAGRSNPFSVRVSAKPVRLDADPAFDVFRRLETAETPPALTRAFGAERAVALLPASAPPAILDAYRVLVDDWAKAETGRIEIRRDDEVADLPADRSVWIFGWENRFASAVARGLAPYGAEVRSDGVKLGPFERARADLAAVAVARHPKRDDLVLAWVAADGAAQVPGLGRKLPHYHKYSYLAFEGDEPTNVAKGRWPVVGSPLTVALADGPLPERGKLAPRKPLASPPPAFSVERITKFVRELSSPAMEGRAPNSAGHERAGEAIAAAFREAGLAPAGDATGSYFKAWDATAGTPPRDVRLRNIVGRIAGTKSEYDKQAIVVGAHYDHLGTGWPEARQGNEGKPHPGADDNASGVAALVELARAFAQGPSPDRTILFVAFDGEEAGRLGSKRLLEDLKRDGLDIRAMINLDTVGRLGNRKVLVLGTGTATEWVHVVRGAGFVTGVPVESVANDPGGSDQVSFHEAGIPAVQLFTGPHLDYHAPGDTADKLDGEGIAKVASIAREAIEYVAGRAEPLTKPGASSSPGTAAASQGRKVSLGTIPEFAFPGPGVKLDGVVPGSPAEKAGLRKGDVVVALAGIDTPNLKAFSDALKTLAPGQKVAVTFERDGKRDSVEAEIVTR